MTPTEAARVDDHALRVAFEERRAELRRTAEWYRTNSVGQSWVDLAIDNAVRLEELDRLADAVIQTGHSIASKCQSDYLGGPGCTCVAVAR